MGASIIVSIGWLRFESLVSRGSLFEFLILVLLDWFVRAKAEDLAKMPLGAEPSNIMIGHRDDGGIVSLSETTVSGTVSELARFPGQRGRGLAR